MSETIQTKKCPKCKQIKCLDEFSKAKNQKDGLQCWCKQCAKEYQNQYYQEHEPQYQQYRQTHKSEEQQYYQTHKAEFFKHQKQCRKTIRGCLRYTFTDMLKRCSNPKRKDYKYYGGRGVQVKFTSFDDFYDYVVNELKTDPRGLSIDRIDNDGHYEKGNIRFVTHKENCRNRRKRVYFRN